MKAARSVGPALFVGGKGGGKATWMFLAAPSLAGIAAGLLFSIKALKAPSVGSTAATAKAQIGL